MIVFTTRLSAEVLDQLQDGARERMRIEALDALLTDSPEDVAYLTGFFHHPCERPVAVWVNADGGTVLLVPELERENAERQKARADIVSYPEFPGVLPPFCALAERVGRAGRVGYSTGMTWERQKAAFAELVVTEAVPTSLITVARFVKLPEEIVLHEEAARITDLMLEAGVGLVCEGLSFRRRPNSRRRLVVWAWRRCPPSTMMWWLSRRLPVAWCTPVPTLHTRTACPPATGCAPVTPSCSHWAVPSAVGSSRVSARSCWGSPAPNSAATTTPCA